MNQENPSNQTQGYSPNHGYTPPQKTPFVQYIFVVSIVLLVFAAIRFLSTAVSIADYRALVQLAKDANVEESIIQTVQSLQSIASLTLLVVMAWLATMIILLVNASKAKNSFNSLTKRLSAAQSAFVVSIIASSVCVIYFFLEVAVFATIANLEEHLDAIFFAEMKSNISGSILAVGTFCGLLIASIVKANSLKKYLKEKIETSTEW